MIRPDLLQPPTTKRECAFARTISTALDAEWREKVQAALTNPDVSNGSIHRFMQANSIPCDKTTIGNHRAGRCRCAG